MPTPQVSALMEYRITSYNVCYTKLLRDVDAGIDGDRGDEANLEFGRERLYALVEQAVGHGGIQQGADDAAMQQATVTLQWGRQLASGSDSISPHREAQAQGMGIVLATERAVSVLLQTLLVDC